MSRALAKPSKLVATGAGHARATMADFRENTTFRCEVCEDYFSREVWHCPVCDHHWPMWDDECGNCHAARRPEHPGTAGRPTGAPSGDLPI